MLNVNVSPVICAPLKTGVVQTVPEQAVKFLVQVLALTA